MEVLSKGSGNPPVDKKETTLPVSISPDNLADIIQDSGNKKPLSDFDNAVLKSFAEARETTSTTTPKVKEEAPEIDVDKTVEKIPLLSDASKNEVVEKPKTATISKEHRDAFLACLVTGDRYTENFTLFGGTIKVVIRCRSLNETEAIESHIRRQVASGKVVSQMEYQNAVRNALIAAQVARVGDITYPELERPLFYTEDDDGVTPPAWISRLDIWGNKPDAYTGALIQCILEFEARYWTMVRKARDENFWKTGEYTEE